MVMLPARSGLHLFLKKYHWCCSLKYWFMRQIILSPKERFAATNMAFVLC